MQTCFLKVLFDKQNVGFECDFVALSFFFFIFLFFRVRRSDLTIVAARVPKAPPSTGRAKTRRRRKRRRSPRPASKISRSMPISMPIHFIELLWLLFFCTPILYNSFYLALHLSFSLSLYPSIYTFFLIFPSTR